LDRLRGPRLSLQSERCFRPRRLCRADKVTNKSGPHGRARHCRALSLFGAASGFPSAIDRDRPARFAGPPGAA
jgi:hypothetical protein